MGVIIQSLNSMRYLYIIFLLSFCVLVQLRAQSAQKQLTAYGSVEVSIAKADYKKSLDNVSGLYLDHRRGADSLYFVCTPQAFEDLLERGVPFRVTDKKKGKLRMAHFDDIVGLNKSNACMDPLNVYPTYEAYDSLMHYYAEMYPDKAELIDLGTLPSGRKILAIKISNGEEDVLKPNFMYSSTMHGDEIVGYILMLNLIDDLLCDGSTDSQIDRLVDGLNIYINPLANPDGTYRGGNHTVENATRFNRNFFDLNRNFPDPVIGEPNNMQAETELFTAFADSVDLHMSCNLHSGIELINYPWDAFSDRHPDDEWFMRVSRDYADTVQHNSPDGYFTALNNGITHGHDWYEVNGGRQDYHVYFKRGRETTLELSDVKLLDADTLVSYWAYNRSALLNYMEEALYGVKGIITDCSTGELMRAEVYIEGHDEMNSSVFSSAKTGAYFRYLAEGDYLISYTAEGYDTVSYLTNIVDKSIIIQDVSLCPTDMSVLDDNIAERLKFSLEGNKILFSGDMSTIPFVYEIYDVTGRKCQSGTLVDRSIDINFESTAGYYLLRLAQGQTIALTKAFFYSPR